MVSSEGPAEVWKDLYLLVMPELSCLLQVAMVSWNLGGMYRGDPLIGDPIANQCPRASDVTSVSLRYSSHCRSDPHAPPPPLVS